MKNFLPFMLIKTIITVALFGGLPGVPRGIIKAKADDVEYFELYSNNQIFLLSEDTFVSEMTAYRSPASPKDETVRFTDADAALEMSFEDIQLSGTTGSGSSQRDNVDISNARITLESSEKNYVVQFVLFGRTSPETIEEDQNYLFYVSSGTKILSLPLQQIFGTLDLSKWWLISAQLHEENRPIGYSDWDASPFATPIPINTEALYFTQRYIECFVPQYNYLAGFNSSLFYHTSWGLMTCGNAKLEFSLPTEASWSIDEPTYIKVGTTQRSFFQAPTVYGITQTYPANTGKMFIYITNDASVIDTNTNTIYPTGAVFESPLLRFVLVDFLNEQISAIYAGESQDDLVAGYNSQNIAAFDFFRVCCPANITLPPSPPQPEPEPEPEPLFKSDWSTWQGAAATVISGISTIILTGIYVVPSIIAGVVLAAKEGRSIFPIGLTNGLLLFVDFFRTTWNGFFDVLSPILNAVSKIIDSIGNFFVKFIEKVVPVLKPIIEWILAFIGDYWYVILPVAIAIFVTVQIQKTRRR